MPTAATNSLVSYNAPTSSIVTFYISALDIYAQSDVGVSGIYQGETTTQNQVSYQAITEMVDIPYTEAATWFKFQTIADDDNLNTIGNGIIGMKGVDSAFTSVVSVPSKSKLLKTDYLNTLAEYVFGNREVADFFTNQKEIKDAWDVAKNDAVANLNDSLAAEGGDDYKLAKDASMELVKNMLVNNANRFALEYNAVLDDAQKAPNSPEENLDVVGGSGTGAKVTIIADVDNGMKQIVIGNTVTTDAETGVQTTTHHTGSGYLANDTVTITVQSGGVFTIQLNSVQAAILNGETDTVGANPPLLPGDKIRVKYTINSPGDQLDKNNSEVSFSQTFYVDYLLQAV